MASASTWVRLLPSAGRLDEQGQLRHQRVPIPVTLVETAVAAGLECGEEIEADGDLAQMT